MDFGDYGGKTNSVDLNKNLNILEDIMIRRMIGTGYLLRMEKGRIPKSVLKGQFCNNRLVEMPKKRRKELFEKMSHKY